jgi:hypothetical protein
VEEAHAYVAIILKYPELIFAVEKGQESYTVDPMSSIYPLDFSPFFMHFINIM